MNLKIKLIIAGILLTFSSIYSKEIDDLKTISIESVSQINLVSSSIPVSVVQTETGKEIKFHLYGNAIFEVGLDISKDGDIVNAKLQSKRSLPISGKLNLDISIPAQYSNSVSLKTSSGKLSIDSLNLSEIKLKSSSGKIETGYLHAAKVSMETSSGNITAGKIKTDSLMITGSSSGVTIDQCTAKSGHIRTSSGAIRMKKCNGKFDISASSGGIHLEYDQFDNQELVAQASSGSITIYLPQNAEFLIDAKMSSGKLQSDFPIDRVENSGKKEISGKVGTKQNRISVKTTSGQIKLVKM